MLGTLPPYLRDNRTEWSLPAFVIVLLFRSIRDHLWRRGFLGQVVAGFRAQATDALVFLPMTC